MSQDEEELKNLLTKMMFKILQARLQQYVNRELQMFKLVSEKAEEPEIKLPTYAGSSKKQQSSRKTSYFCFLDYAKASDCVDHNKLWKILKEMEILDHLTCLLRNLQVRKQQLELDIEKQIGSK